MCVQVRYLLWGLIAKEPVHEQTFVIFKRERERERVMMMMMMYDEMRCFIE